MTADRHLAAPNSDREPITRAGQSLVKARGCEHCHVPRGCLRSPNIGRDNRPERSVLACETQTVPRSVSGKTLRRRWIPPSG